MGDSIRQPIALSEQQVEQLRRTTQNGTTNFPAGYDLIYGWIKNNKAAQEDGTVFWFEQARGINGDDSVSARFIRRHTENGLDIAGVPKSERMNMQDLSNEIARRVTRDVLRESEVPALPVILSRDISVALNEGKVKLGGWGGSFYYWDMPFKPDDHKGPGFPKDPDGSYRTVGEEIERRYQVGMLVEASSRTLAQMVINKEIGVRDIDDVLSTSFNAGAPAMVKARIGERTAEILLERAKDKWFSEADMPTGPVPPGQERRQAMAGLMVNEQGHRHHAMHASIESALHAEDRARGREPHPRSAEIAASLVCDARERGLDTVGFCKLSPDGRFAYMTDTADPSKEWAKTAVGDMGGAAQSTLQESTQRAANIDQALEQQRIPALASAQGIEAPSQAPKSLSM